MKKITKSALKELNNENIPIRELEFGLLSSNKPHGKQEVLKITSDAEEIKQELEKGWSLYPGIYKWVIKAPEQALCDLSDIFHNPTQDPVEILAFYRCLKQTNIKKVIRQVKKSAQLRGLELILLEGESLEAEIRVSGSDIRIHQTPKAILELIRQTTLWKKELKKTNKLLKKRGFSIRFKRFDRSSHLTKNFFGEISQKYLCITKLKKPDEIITGVWQKIPPADIYLFVPKAGLKYLLGYVEDSQACQKVMLWEYHSGLDRCKELIIFPKKIRGKKVAIVDRFYSGSTLAYLLKQIGMLGAKPIGIGLFPKSKKALKQMDYILFLDKFIKSNQLPIKKNWCEEAFVQVINGYV